MYKKCGILIRMKRQDVVSSAPSQEIIATALSGDRGVQGVPEAYKLDSFDSNAVLESIEIARRARDRRRLLSLVTLAESIAPVWLPFNHMDDGSLVLTHATWRPTVERGVGRSLGEEEVVYTVTVIPTEQEGVHGGVVCRTGRSNTFIHETIVGGGIVDDELTRTVGKLFAEIDVQLPDSDQG